MTLPELPEPAQIVTYNESKGYTAGMFTADQMRAYAKAALAQTGAEPAVNYFAVQEMADKWHVDYNVLSAAIRGYLALAATTAQPAPLPAREPLTRYDINLVSRV